MNLCLESHYPEEVLERCAMGKLSSPDYVPLEEHLLICTACQTNLLVVEDYIQIACTALAASQTSAHVGLQPLQCSGTSATVY
jgi:hypothetical protein